MMKGLALLSAVAVLCGLGIGIGSSWYEFASGTNHFSIAGMEPAERWPQRDGDTDKGSAENGSTDKPELADAPNVSRGGPSQVYDSDTAGHGKLFVVNGETHDFGSMDLNTTKEHTFILKNIGSAPLAIERGRTTCKCTVSELPTGKIRPGETVEVKLEWTPKVFEEEFRQTAEFKTSDPDRQIVFLTVTGQIIESITTFPSRIVFSDISPNEPTTINVSVLSYKHDNLKCEGLELNNPESAPYFDVQVHELSRERIESEFRAKSGFLVAITAKEGIPIGRIHQTLRVVTNRHVAQGLQIPVHGRVVGDITFRPQPGLDVKRNLLGLGYLKQQQTIKRTVYLLVKGRHVDEVELSVSDEEIRPSDVIQASIGAPIHIARGTARMFPLAITIPQGSRAISCLGPDPENLGKIVIQTTHPTMKKVALYVMFLIEG